MLTKEYLNEVLDYCPTSGVFTWKKRISRRGVVGSVAGAPDPVKPYWRIKIAGKQYMAHRLAWLSVYGSWPKDQIDHINGMKGDNRISNLRQCTPLQNAINRAGLSALGHKGVSPSGSGFRARITVGKQRLNLGWFATAKDAGAAYQAKSRQLHGEFATDRHLQQARKIGDGFVCASTFTDY
jgi:hypothetical protein